MRPSGRRRSTPTSEEGSTDGVVNSQMWLPSPRLLLSATDPSATLTSRSPGLRSSRGVSSHLSISADIPIYLTDLFYANFYPDHPFVLPREQLVKELAAVEHCPLQAVIEYIGTFYDATFDRNVYQTRAEELLSNQQYPSDGSLVQALLILAIGLNTDGHSAKADLVLQRARSCAITIGMDDRAFASLGPGGQVVQVESWRRTWLALQDLYHMWQQPPTLSTDSAFSRCTTAESAAALEATMQFESSSTLPTSMAWKGFGPSPFAQRSGFHAPSDIGTRQGDRDNDDSNTYAIDELLAQAGLYDGVGPHNAKNTTGWRSQPDILSGAQDSRPATAENDYTRMMSQG